MSGPVRFFIDTEFIEDGERIHPLAIAVVTEDGDAFYAVVTDVDRSLAGDWVKANVLPYLDEMPPQCDVATRGTRSQVAHALRNWVAMRSDAPEFWADYGAYDWVLVCQLFGTMMDLPDGWPMFVRDIQQIRNGEELPQPEHEHQAVSDALCARDRWRILTAAPAPAVPVEPAATDDLPPWRPDNGPGRPLRDDERSWLTAGEVRAICDEAEAATDALRAALAAPSPATVPGTSHVVKLVQVGGRVEVLIDGKLVIGTPQARDQRDIQTTLTTFRCVASSAAPSPAEPEGLVERVAKAIKAADDAWMTEGGTQPPALTEEGAHELARAALAAIAAGAPGSTGTGGAATGEHAHDFLPVRGHPDDDECTFRVDGTDDTYCGLTEAEHPAPTPPVVPTEDEQP